MLNGFRHKVRLVPGGQPAQRHRTLGCPPALCAGWLHREVARGCLVEGGAAVGHGARAKRWGDFEEEAPALSLYVPGEAAEQEEALGRLAGGGR